MANQPRAKRPGPPRRPAAAFAIPPSQLRFLRLTDPPRRGVVRQLAHRGLELKYFCGKTIKDLTYQPVFLGEAWQSELLLELGGKLTTHLATAMQSTELNEVFKQYFNGDAVSATPLGAEFCPYVSAEGHDDIPWKPYFYGEDAQHTIAFLHGQGIPQQDLENSAVLLLLAPGTILFKRNDPSGRDVSTGFLNSMGGLASYHNYVDLVGGDRVYYAVSVWSDGENGAAIPGWQPWESTCAGVYHELAETRTNPNITGEVPDDNWGWASSEGEEIGDLSVDWAGDDPTQVFKRDLPNLAGVPVELLWSNANKQPYMPP